VAGSVGCREAAQPSLRQSTELVLAGVSLVLNSCFRPGFPFQEERKETEGLRRMPLNVFISAGVIEKPLHVMEFLRCNGE
jgi:hypothetical protein